MEVLIQFPMEVLATMGPRAPPTLVAQGLVLLLKQLRHPHGVEELYPRWVSITTVARFLTMLVGFRMSRVPQALDLRLHQPFPPGNLLLSRFLLACSNLPLRLSRFLLACSNLLLAQAGHAQ